MDYLCHNKDITSSCLTQGESVLYVKTLTLDYDYFDNEFFELYVINDQVIELYHESSGTVYEFTGREYIQYMKVGKEIDKTKSSAEKKRKQRTKQKDNPRDNTRN